ncbi:MAG: hypothetical protein ACRDJ4_07205, partial [Actinomycetota bacterium]
VTGRVASTAGNFFALARYLPDGSLDASFGSGGLVLTDVSGSISETDSAFALALQPDGKIVSVGLVAEQFGLVRYLPDGSLDPTFGTGGIVKTSIGPFSAARSVALQADGKIMAVGRTDPGDITAGDWALARYNPDGSLDSTFAGGGTVVTDFHGKNDSGGGVVIQPDQKIVVAGRSGDDGALARYLPDGSLDPSFGGGGKVVVGAFNTAEAGIALQPDGKIVASGNDVIQGAIGLDDAVIGRFHPDGSLDKSFGRKGIVTTDLDADQDESSDVAVQSDGKIVMVGRSVVDGAFAFSAARYLGDPVTAPLAEHCPGMSIDRVGYGTTGDDTLRGGAKRDLLLALDGSDAVVGGGGADCIHGGLGADSIMGAGGNDLIGIAAGDVPAGATETIAGGLGTDTLLLGEGLTTSDVSGSAPTFTVTDPVTGGVYSVSGVETIGDA